MKLVRLSIVAILLSLVATSCHKEYITEEQHINNYYAQVNTIEYTVQASDWSLVNDDNGRNYLLAQFDCPEINDQIFDEGAVIGYVWITYDQTTGASSWNALPYVYPYTYENEDGTQAVGENFRFEYEPGLVSFIVEDLDAYNPDDMDASMQFKVVIVSNR